MAATETDQFLQVDGIKTRYRDEGSGPPVVLLHGAAMGSSLDVWDQHYPPLVAAGLRLISYDRPGFGGSDETDDGSPAFQRAFLLKLLDALGLDTVGLVGHSQAGGFVIQLALDHPQRVSRVMVLGTGSLLPPLEGVPPNPPDPTGEASREIVRLILEEQLYHHDLITPQLIEARYQRALGHAPRPAAPAASPVSPPTPLWQRLGELAMPLMLIYGENDRGSVPTRAKLLGERYPQLSIWVVPNAKHLLQWDASDEFIAAAKDFFA